MEEPLMTVIDGNIGGGGSSQRVELWKEEGHPHMLAWEDGWKRHNLPKSWG